MQKALKGFLSILCFIACCPCCFPCYYCAFRNRKSRRNPHNQELELWRGPRSPTDVHPLPSRKRRLTLPSGIERPHLEPEQKVIDQKESLLFAKLPLELRRQIWAEVVGGFDIYVGIVDQKLQHCKVWGQGPNGDQRTFHLLLPILLTCRQIYSEAIPFLYSSNRFRTSHIDVVPALTSSIRLSRFNVITSLALSWSLPAIYRHTLFGVQTHEAKVWARTAYILRSMKGLKDLHILLWTCTPHGTAWQWAGVKELLDLLRQVKPKQHYCLTIDEIEVVDLTAEYKDAPFELHWKDAVKEAGKAIRGPLSQARYSTGCDECVFIPRWF